MAWALLLAVLLLTLAVSLARWRRRLFFGSRSEPLPTLSLSKRPEKKKKAALDAATASLR